MLFECVCVCSTCFKIYTNLPCGKSMYIYGKALSARPKEHTSLSINYSLYINSDLRGLSHNTFIAPGRNLT